MNMYNVISANDVRLFQFVICHHVMNLFSAGWSAKVTLAAPVCAVVVAGAAAGAELWNE